MKKKSRKSRPAEAAPKAGKPVPGKFKQFLQALVQKRADILEFVRHKDTDVPMGEIGDEADVASQTFEREMMFEMTNGERIILDDIEAALRKIEKGNFGICESCRKKISDERLKAMPWARYCVQCQSRVESPA